MLSPRDYVYRQYNVHIIKQLLLWVKMDYYWFKWKAQDVGLWNNTINNHPMGYFFDVKFKMYETNITANCTFNNISKQFSALGGNTQKQVLINN